MLNIVKENCDKEVEHNGYITSTHTFAKYEIVPIYLYDLPDVCRIHGNVYYIKKKNLSMTLFFPTSI